jgi:2-dehydropantoate 2-reductase
MKILVVGAGATGGYIGAQLVRAGRDVTFLVRPRAQSRLASHGVRIRIRNEISTTKVNAVNRPDLSGTYDVVVVAVRSDAVGSAVEDFRPAVGVDTRIIPLTNGMAHLSTLTTAFGTEEVLGASAKLATSLLPDGTIEEVQPGATLEIGSLEGARSADLSAIATEFGVDDVTVTVTDTVLATMWAKFAFITATSVLTCLAGEVIGSVARACGGVSLAGQVLDEINAVAAAEGYPLGSPAESTLHGLLADPQSRFAPSLFRDLHAGRPVEVSVLNDMAARARRHRIATPLLDASIVVIDVRQTVTRESPALAHSE